LLSITTKKFVAKPKFLLRQQNFIAKLEQQQHFYHVSAQQSHADYNTVGTVTKQQQLNHHHITHYCMVA